MAVPESEVAENEKLPVQKAVITADFDAR
jgi:hypothetical protein